MARVSVEIALVGFGVGLFYGVFGAGGSAFATPILALLGVPPLVAVASPLPGTVPAAAVGAWTYWRTGALETDIARRAIAAGVPGVVLGGVASRFVGGKALLLLSGLVLCVLGVRIVVSRRRDTAAPPVRRSGRLVTGGAFVVGFATGLLANSGGFLLVPLFLLGVGLEMRAAVATSMVVASVLTIPAVAVHALLGSIDWRIALLFGIGLTPGTAVGARVASRLEQDGAAPAFGVVLTAFGVWFVARLLLRL